MFGVVGLLAAAGDIRMMRAGGIQAPRRLARHLWRMCVAAASFFWGPPDRVPEAIRIPALQAVAVLAPIVVMVYWLVRVRGGRTSHVVRATAPDATAAAISGSASHRAL